MGMKEVILSRVEDLKSVGRRYEAFELEKILDHYKEYGDFSPNQVNTLHSVGIRV